jgi:hypothetical protein
MRRLFVIWLILLFPLNVLAMSMSVAAFEHVDHDQHGQQERVESVAPAADTLFSHLFDTQSSGDLDSDEPPAVADLHDQVNEEDQLQLVLLPGRSIAAGAPLRHEQSAFPPLKPPPTL